MKLYFSFFDKVVGRALNGKSWRIREGHVQKKFINFTAAMTNYICFVTFIYYQFGKYVDLQVSSPLVPAMSKYIWLP